MHEKPVVLELKPFGKAFVEPVDKKKISSIQYFNQKEKVNEKYKKIMDIIRDEQLLEIRNRLSRVRG